MSPINVLFDRTRLIKDPVWVSVEMILRKRIEDLKKNDPDYELEVAEARYQGLLAGDVHIEPVADTSKGHKVCISSRKTGFLRIDLNVFPLELPEILTGLKEPVKRVNTIHEVLGLFLEKNPDVKFVHCSENGKLYAFVPGLDNTQETKDLIGEIFFDKVSVEQLSVEGSVPSDYCDRIIHLSDSSLMDGKDDIHLIAYSFAEDLVKDDRISISLIPGQDQLQFKESRPFIDGNQFNISVSQGDPSKHSPIVVEELFWDHNSVVTHDTLLSKKDDGSYVLHYSGWFGTADNFDVLECELVLSTTRLSDGKKILSNRISLKNIFAGYQTNRFQVQELTWLLGTSNFEFKIFDNCVNALVQDNKWDLVLGGTAIPKDKVLLTGEYYQVNDQVDNVGDFDLVGTRVRRHVDGTLSVKPEVDGVVVTETVKKITGTQLYLEYLHKYTGLDVPVEEVIWDGALNGSRGLKDPGQVTSYHYDKLTGILSVNMEIVLPVNQRDGYYQWEWYTTAGPLVDCFYSGELDLPADEIWMPVLPPVVDHDWDAGEIKVTVEVKNPDGSIPPKVDLILPPSVTGPVSDEDVTWVYNPTTGELEITFKGNVPDAGADIKIDVIITDGDGHFGEVKVEETLPQKSTMIVTFLNAALDLTPAIPTLTWNYQVSSKDGVTKFNAASMGMPAIVATNTLAGTLNAKSQHFDKTTQQGYVVYEVVTSGNQEIHYTLSGTIVADATGNEPVVWSFIQPPTGGYYVTPLSATLQNGALVQKLQVNNKDGIKASRANIITLGTTVGLDPNDLFPRAQAFDSVEQIHTFTVSAVQTPNLVQRYTIGGDLFIDDVPIPFMVDHNAVQYVPETASTYFENGRACVELRFMQNSQESTGDFQATLVSLTNKATSPDFTFARKPGSPTRWIYSAAVNPPTTTAMNYDFVVKFDYTSNLIKISVNQNQRVTQNYEIAGSATIIANLCKVEDHGEIISGVNPAGILTQAYLVKLKDGTFPKACKVKRPMGNVSYAVGSDFPQTETYDPATGILILAAKVYLAFLEDRSYTMLGTTESVTPSSIQAANFVGSYTQPRHRNLIVTKVSDSTNAARNELTVNYQAAHEDGTLPLTVAMAKPFSSVTPSDTMTGYSPIREAYDPATGLGSFTFAFTPKTDTAITSNLTTSFTSPGINPANNVKFTSIIPADLSFKATQNKVEYNETTGSMRVEYLIKNSANAFPASCTMGDLVSVTNTVGGTKTPTSQGYDPATGIFYYVIPVVKGAVQAQTLAYKFVGNLTVTDSPVITVTVDLPAYKYTLVAAVPTIENQALATRQTRQFLTVTREGTAGNIRTIVVENMVCAKKDPTREPSQRMESDGMLGVYMPITAPETTKRTYYTTTGDLVITTPEGMKLRLAFTGTATAFITAGSGQVDNRLLSMDLAAGVMTVVIQSYWTGSGGMSVYGGKLQTPMSAAYNSVPADPKTPTYQAWDDANSTLTFKFNVNPPTAGNGGYYLFRGRIDYPEYSGYVSDEFEVNKTFPV